VNRRARKRSVPSAFCCRRQAHLQHQFKRAKVYLAPIPCINSNGRKCTWHRFPLVADAVGLFTASMILEFVWQRSLTRTVARVDR
jgi:hypothetical protein